MSSESENEEQSTYKFPFLSFFILPAMRAHVNAKLDKMQMDVLYIVLIFVCL